MRLMRVVLLLCLVFLVGCPAGTSSSASSSSPPDSVTFETLLDKARVSPSVDTYYAPPTLKERMNLHKTIPDFADALHAGEVDLEVFKERFKQSGLKLRPIKVDDEDCLVIYEAGPAWRGTGFYVFRVGPAKEVLLQAPHSFHDMHTGDLMLETFRQTKARGVYVNSVHRYRSHPDEDEDALGHPADMAHNTDSVFYMMSIEYLRTVRDALVVQVHGYRDKRLKEAGFEIVVSDGTEEPHPRVRKAAVVLAEQLKGTKVAIYPDDTKKLGATGNTVGRWVTHSKIGAFLHLELAIAVRKGWKADPKALIDLVEVLSGDL